MQISHHTDAVSTVRQNKTCRTNDAGRFLSRMRGLVMGAFCVAAVLMFVTMSALGQASTATFGGRVFDPESRVVQNAVVTVTSVETGTKWKSTSNSGGDWRVQGLPVGHYTFQVEASGFKTQDHAAVELQVSDQKFVDSTLSLGAATETVTVESATPLIDTTAAVSGTVITTAEMDELPSITNSPVDLVRLTPGATFGQPSGGAAHLWSNNSESEVAVDFSGSGTNAVNYQIEGSSNTNGGGQIAFIPPTDAVAELRVSKNAYDASIGRSAAGTVDMTFKSGTNAFHGVLYEINQNNALNARTYNQAANTPLTAIHTNEFGGTLGGPVWIPKIFDGRKNHTFFFFSYDGIRSKSPSTTNTLSVPTMAERAGDFGSSYTVSNKVTYTTQIYDPTTINPVTHVRMPFPASALPPPGSSAVPVNPATPCSATSCPVGMAIPTQKISAVAKAFWALVPAPDNLGDFQNSDSNNFNNRSVKNDPFNSYILRVDKAWNDSNHSFAELRRNQLNEVQGSQFGAGNLLNGDELDRKNLGMTLDHSWVASPRLVVDLRGDITAWDTDTVSPSYGIDPLKYGFSTNLTNAQGVATLPQITGLPMGNSLTNQAPSYTNDIIYEGTGTVTHIVGRHALKYGAEYLVQQEGTGNIGTNYGTFGFGNNWTTQNPFVTAGPGVGSTVASFDLGMPTGGSIGTPATAFWSQPYVAVFVQDDWRITNKLTLNLGLRWDEQRPLTERHNKFFTIFDSNANIAPVTDYAQPNYAATISGPSTDPGVQFLQQNRPDASGFVARGAIQYAGVNGTSRANTNSTLKYFQPRIGFAYTFGPRTVIRGGFGRFVEANFVPGHGNQTGFSASTPFTATNDNYQTQYGTLENPFPQGITPVTGTSLGPLTQVGNIGSFYAPTVPRQYSDEVSLHLQQQVSKFLFEIGGTLNLTHGILVGYDIDEPGTATWLAAFTPKFDSAGRPLDILPGNNQVANPFLGAPYITSSLKTNKTVSAYSLVLPNPLRELTENKYTGTNTYYSLQTRVERRYSNGLGVLASFTWGKDMSTTGRVLPQAVSEDLFRQLSSGDQRFLFSITPTYELPIGRGQFIGRHMYRWADEVVGGWKLTAIYNFTSGTPIGLPTNSAFFQGGDPAAGGAHTKQQWFNTAKFAPFPSKSTTVAQLQAYPTWTGVQSLPGASWVPASSSDASKNGVYQDFATWRTENATYYGNVRNPAFQDLDVGLRKSFPLGEKRRFELRLDAFNALNHPTFGGPNTSPGNTYFGVIGGTSPDHVQTAGGTTPRELQYSGKLYF